MVQGWKSFANPAIHSWANAVTRMVSVDRARAPTALARSPRGSRFSLESRMASWVSWRRFIRSYSSSVSSFSHATIEIGFMRMRPNGWRVSRAASLLSYASIRSTSHNRFGSRYQAAAAASDCTRLLGSATMQGER
jgi:hypothetical protein